MRRFRPAVPADLSGLVALSHLVVLLHLFRLAVPADLSGLVALVVPADLLRRFRPAVLEDLSGLVVLSHLVALEDRQLLFRLAVLSCLSDPLGLVGQLNLAGLEHLVDR